MGLFVEFPFHSVVLYVYSYANIAHFDYCSFAVVLKLGSMTLIPVFEDYFGYSGSLAIQDELTLWLFNFYKNGFWNFHWDCTESVD